MKKFLFALVALFTVTVQASAMSYEQAREQALFLTDKMAYELNLTDDQYEAAYEVNLDYLMGINTYDDLYGAYWRQRNLDLSYILFDWQYRMFCDASYFYRPLYWDGGFWHFAIYARYPHRDYFYFGRPVFYVSYRGAHSWRLNGGRSWYRGRTWGGPRPGGDRRIGMRDGFQRGDYGRGERIQSNRTFGNGTRFDSRPGSQARFGTRNGSTSRTRSYGGGQPNRSFGSGVRESSTRSTVTRPSGGSFGSRSTTSGEPRRTFTPNGSGSTRSFGSGAPSRSFGSSSAPSRSFGSGAPSRSFGSSSAPTRSFGGSAPSRSSSHSFGGGGSSSHSSGGHFGRR